MNFLEVWEDNLDSNEKENDFFVIFKYSVVSNKDHKVKVLIAI